MYGDGELLVPVFPRLLVPSGVCNGLPSHSDIGREHSPTLPSITGKRLKRTSRATEQEADPRRTFGARRHVWFSNHPATATVRELANPPEVPRLSRGPGTHQREILRRLNAHGWTWVVDLPFRSRADYTSYWRAIRRLEAQGHLRVEHRTRRGYFRRWALIVNVMQIPNGPALPIDESYWPPEIFHRSTVIDVKASHEPESC